MLLLVQLEHFCVFYGFTRSHVHVCRQCIARGGLGFGLGFWLENIEKSKESRDKCKSGFCPLLLPASWTLPSDFGDCLWPPPIKPGWLLSFLFGSSPSMPLGIPPVRACWSVSDLFLPNVTLLWRHWIKPWSITPGPMFGLFPNSEGRPRQLTLRGVPQLEP